MKYDRENSSPAHLSLGMAATAAQQLKPLSICPFLKESEKELKKHDHITNKNLKDILTRFEQCNVAEVLNKVNWDRRQADLHFTLTKLRREKEVLDMKVNRGEDVIKEIHFENNNLHSTLSEAKNESVTLAQKTEELKVEVLQCEEDRENEIEKMKTEQQSMVALKSLYKESLNAHLRLQHSDDNGEVYIFTFDRNILRETKEMPNNSVKLLLSTKGSWKLLGTNPAVKNFEEVSEKLEKSQDVQGLLAYLKDTLKGKRKHRK